MPINKMPMDVLVVGCGAVVEGLYKRAFKNLCKTNIINLVGFVDPDIRRARKISRFFPKASVFDRIEDALSRFRVNLTILASPPAFHAAQAILAMESGSHILCEKPMAVSSSDCEAMLFASEKNQRKLSLGMTRRYYPSFYQLKQLIQNGSFPGPYTFSCREGAYYQWPVMSLAGFQRPVGGGGILTDIGSHDLDLLLWFFGLPETVRCQDDAMTGGVETNCRVDLKGTHFEGFLQLSWDHELSGQLHVKGSSGEALIRMDGTDRLYLNNGNGFEWVRPTPFLPVSVSEKAALRKYPRTHEECFDLQIINILRAIQFDEPLMATGWDGLQTMRVIEKCYAHSELFRMPWLTPDQISRYETFFWKK